VPWLVTKPPLQAGMLSQSTTLAHATPLEMVFLAIQRRRCDGYRSPQSEVSHGLYIFLECIYVTVKDVIGMSSELFVVSAMRREGGCNEIFMQSQGVLAAENAKGAKLMPRSRPVEDP